MSNAVCECPRRSLVSLLIAINASLWVCAAASRGLAQDQKSGTIGKEVKSKTVATTPSAQDAAPEKSENRTMQIKVLGPNAQPLPKSKIHVAVWTSDPFKRNQDYVCDDDGTVTIDLPHQIEILRLWAHHDGHVGQYANWQAQVGQDPRKIPEAFSFHLEKGKVIGGIIKNDEGEPIVGAKVEVQLVKQNGENGRNNGPIPNIWLSYGDNCQRTDVEGRWSLNNAPAGNLYGYLVMLNHPDYVSDYEWGGLQKQQGVLSKSFQDNSATLVMHRGSRVSGTIVGSDGTPIPDAVVIWGEDPYLQWGSQEVRTDKNGSYVFPPLPIENLQITVVAKGWAPDQRSVALEPGQTTADFKLSVGKSLRIQFIDQRGNPIPEVGVGIERWRSMKSLYNHKHPNVLDTNIPVQADMNGIYEWEWAPADEVTYSFYKAGFKHRENVRLEASDDEEYRIILEK